MTSPDQALLDAATAARPFEALGDPIRVGNAAIDTLAAVLAPAGSLRDASACCG